MTTQALIEELEKYSKSASGKGSYLCMSAADKLRTLSMENEILLAGPKVTRLFGYTLDEIFEICKADAKRKERSVNRKYILKWVQK